jgi:hypothetical protein
MSKELPAEDGNERKTTGFGRAIRAREDLEHEQ